MMKIICWLLSSGSTLRVSRSWGHHRAEEEYPFSTPRDQTPSLGKVSDRNELSRLSRSRNSECRFHQSSEEDDCQGLGLSLQVAGSGAACHRFCRPSRRSSPHAWEESSLHP